MSESVEIEYLLTVNTEMTYSELRKIETMLIRLSGYVQRLAGNENLDKLMNKIQQTIHYIRALQIALIALQAAMVPGAGWIKVAWVGFAATNAAFAGYDMLRGY